MAFHLKKLSMAWWILVAYLLQLCVLQPARASVTFYPQRIMEGGSNVIRLTTTVTGLASSVVAEGDRLCAAIAICDDLTRPSSCRGEPGKWRRIWVDLKYKHSQPCNSVQVRPTPLNPGELRKLERNSVAAKALFWPRGWRRQAAGVILRLPVYGSGFDGVERSTTTKIYVHAVRCKQCCGSPNPNNTVTLRSLSSFAVRHRE